MTVRYRATTLLIAAANMALGSALRSQGLPPMTLGVVTIAIASMVTTARPEWTLTQSL